MYNNIATAPYITTRIIATTYSLNGSLTLLVTFDRIQESCAKWKNSVELQFLDMPIDDVIHKLSCVETGETSVSLQKNCTLFIQIDESSLCRSTLHLKIRPLLSTLEENVTLYRGSWTDTTIKPAKPEGWDKDETFKNFVVEANFRNQSLTLEWENPICLKGSVSLTANFSIVSGSKYEYHFTIPAQCSRSKNDLLKNSITINNGEITCSDGKKLEMETNFKLQPCREYSLTATPLVSDATSVRHLSAYSTTNTFTTEFSPLDIDKLSPDEVYMTASHVSGYLWELTLYLKKEYSPCDERIVSASFISPNSKQIDQTISCNRSLVCNGMVEFNHINLCRPLAVTVGLQYFNSNNTKTEITTWFNNSLPPLVDEHNKLSSSLKILKVKTAGRHFLELQWKDPACLNGIAVSWDMEFRHANGSLLNVLNISYNCSSVITLDGKSADHRMILEENQLVCGGENSSIRYHVNVVLCSDYSINVTPVIEIEGTHKRVREFLQSANFTTFFNTSAVRDMKIVNVSSNNFELQWTIPSRCLPVFEMNLQMNETLFLIKALPFSKTVCDENECRMVWSPSEISLAPCTDYTVIVESTSITLTTFPGHNELAIAPENISVIAELSNDNYLGIKITFDNFGNRCLDRLVGVELNLSDVEPPIQHITLQCDHNTSENRNPSSRKVCSERIKIQKIDKCKTHNLALRPLYGNISLFSNDLVRWTYTDLSPLLSELERSEKKVIPLVKLIETENQQSMMVYWDDPICLLADSLSWEVRINFSSHSRSVKLSSKCSSGWHLPTNIKATSFKHNLQLINGHLSCNASTSAFDSRETDFIFLPCSSYLVSVIPFDSKVIQLEDYSQSTRLNTSLSEIRPKVKNVTSNSFGLEWTFPIQCSQQVKMRQISMEINGTPVEIDPSNLIFECDDTKCTMLWASPQNLSACTEYTVSADALTEKVLTLSDQLDSLERFTTCDFNEGTIAEATDVSYRADNATLITGDLFLIALIIGLSLLGSTLLGIITWIGFYILKRKSTRNNSGKLRIQKHDKHNFPPPAIYGEKDEFGMVDIVF